VNEFRDDPFALIGVHVGGSSVADTGKLMEREQLPWRTFVDPGNATAGPISTSWNAPSTPTFFLLDAKGVIRHKFVGKVDPDVVDAALKRLISEAKGAEQAEKRAP
jgi:hypothetical protein